MSARLLLLALAAPLLGGCAALPGFPKRPADGHGDVARQKGARAGFWRKPVAGHEAPTTLVALDGSRCMVTAKRFEETAPGEKVWCNWQGR
jgi:hypothetical protein